LTRGEGIAAERWRDNWRVLCPGEPIRVDLRVARFERDVPRRLRGLPPGTPVVLTATGPGAARRCRAAAARSGVELEREFLAIPSVQAPGCLVENAPGPVRAFVRSVLVAPQDTRLGPIPDIALAVLRTLGSRWILRLVAPGRIAVGTRS